MADRDDARRQLGGQIQQSMRDNMPLEYRLMSREELQKLADEGKLSLEERIALLGEAE